METLGRWIWDCCNIQGGALCDSNKRLEAVTIITKSSTLDAAAVLDPLLLWKVYILILEKTIVKFRNLQISKILNTNTKRIFQILFKVMHISLRYI